MTKFVNQTIGSHDDKSFEYVSVEWDSKVVRGFRFHSVGTRDVMNRYHTVYGIEVPARYIWQAIKAFCNINVMAVCPDGREFFVTWVSSTELDPVTKLSKWEEFRCPDMYGRTIARMERGPYVQGLTSSLVEA